jgi:hypothetical protein
MSRKRKIATPARQVTKSIRLTREEAQELGRLVEGTAYAEAALMRQWVLSGMQQFRLGEALRAYQEGHLDVRAAAEQAGLPMAVFVEEMAARKVALLEQADAFGPGVEALRASFGRGSRKR